MRLVPPTLALVDAALTGDDALERELGHHVVPGWSTFRGALARAREALVEDPERQEWGSRLFLSGEPPELVGWGGFKGPPINGVVEIGYEIAETRQRRGLATAAARAMVEEALADERVTEVVAHTLPHRNASNRVLEKAGFSFAGKALEGGEVVWRYALARDGAESA